MRKLTEFRKQNGMTIRALARESCITPSYLSDLEKGRKQNPSKDVMEKISRALGRSVPEVFFASIKRKGKEDERASSHSK